MALLLLLALMALRGTESSHPEASLVISERQGNSSFECIASGRCVSCSLDQQQNEDVYHCGRTNHYMAYKCVEVTTSSEGEGQQDEDAGSTLRGSVHNALIHNRLLQEQDKAAAAPKIYHIYKSCVPPIPQERLSVLGFEAIILGMLAIFSPVLYVRKKRGFVPSGMTRVPTTARF